MNRRTAGIALGTFAVLALTGNLASPGSAAWRRGERGEGTTRESRPRSRSRDAIAYMESSREDFGGHKAAALRASRKALKELQAALRYRDRREHEYH